MGITLDEIVFATGSGATDADTLRVELSTESLAALENVTVSATDLDIRDLAFATDSVDVTGSEVALDAATLAALENINVTIDQITSIKNTDEDVTTTAAQVLAAPLASRKEVTIQNEGNQAVYVGSTAGVTSANGTKISKNSSATFSWSASVDIFMVANSGTQDVRFLEAA